jgi:hypothetical protein
VRNKFLGIFSQLVSAVILFQLEEIERDKMLKFSVGNVCAVVEAEASYKHYSREELLSLSSFPRLNEVK